MQSERDRQVLRPSACSFVIGAEVWRKVGIGSGPPLGRTLLGEHQLRVPGHLSLASGREGEGGW